MPRSSCMAGFAEDCAAAVPMSAAVITAIAKAGIRRVMRCLNPQMDFELRHPGRSKPYQSHLWVTSYAVLSMPLHASSPIDSTLPPFPEPASDERQAKELSPDQS